MPLNHSSSDKARSENIATEIKHGKPRDQAAAIGYSVQRKAQHKGAKMSKKHEAENKKEAKMSEGVHWNEGMYPLKGGGDGLEKTEYPIKCSEKHEAENKKEAKFNAMSPTGRKDSEFSKDPSTNKNRVGEMSKTPKAPGSFSMPDHGHHAGKMDMKLCMGMPKLGKVKK
jgi:hypothetical protein